MAIGDDLTRYIHLFPHLDVNDGEVTSADDFFNNCFAWAAGDKENRWETSSPHVWFTESKAETLENYIENYAYVGFEETESPEYEAGYEKIAIYVNAYEEPTHAARMKDDGTWTSKLGNLEDIMHHTLECIGGGDYGTVRAYLKRPEGGPEQWKEKAIQTRLKSSKTSKS